MKIISHLVDEVGSRFERLAARQDFATLSVFCGSQGGAHLSLSPPCLPHQLSALGAEGVGVTLTTVGLRQ